MQMDKTQEQLLRLAVDGGKNDGTLWLIQVEHLLRKGYEQGLKHGLLPDEWVIHLADKLLEIYHQPREADKILKIEKQNRRPKRTQLTRDCVITWMCMKAMEADPDKSNEAIYGEVSDEYVENYNAADTFAIEPGETIDTKRIERIERIYKKTYPIIIRLRHIEGFKWLCEVMKHNDHEDYLSKIADSDCLLFANLAQEILWVQKTIEMIHNIAGIPTDKHDEFILTILDDRKNSVNSQ